MKAGHRLRAPHMIIGLATAGLVVGAVIAADGLLRIRGMQQELRTLEGDVVRLRSETAELTDTVDRLRNDPQTIERLAREELGWVRQGETVLKFPAAPKK